MKRLVSRAKTMLRRLAEHGWPTHSAAIIVDAGSIAIKRRS
jgi:hypothetical protein